MKKEIIRILKMNGVKTNEEQGNKAILSITDRTIKKRYKGKISEISIGSIVEYIKSFVYDDDIIGSFFNTL